MTSTEIACIEKWQAELVVFYGASAGSVIVFGASVTAGAQSAAVTEAPKTG